MANLFLLLAQLASAVRESINPFLLALPLIAVNVALPSSFPKIPPLSPT